MLRVPHGSAFGALYHRRRATLDASSFASSDAFTGLVLHRFSKPPLRTSKPFWGPEHEMLHAQSLKVAAKFSY